MKTRRGALSVALLALSLLPTLAMSSNTTPAVEISAEHRFFVAKYYSSYATEQQALDAAKPPPGAVSHGEFHTADGSTMLAYKMPRGTTDTLGLDVVIFEPSPTGGVRAWLSSTDLSRASKNEADTDLDEFKQIGRGTFKVFERN